MKKHNEFWVVKSGNNLTLCHRVYDKHNGYLQDNIRVHQGEVQRMLLTLYPDKKYEKLKTKQRVKLLQSLTEKFPNKSWQIGHCKS